MEDIKREVLIEQGVNLNDAMHRFLNMEEMYIKFLLRYSEDKSIETMRDAVADSNVEAVFKAAHALKGLAGNLGLDNIYRMSSEITELTRGKSSADEVDMKLVADKIGILAEAHEKLAEVIRSNFNA